MINKIGLRDIVVSNKEKFEQTGNNQYIFISTVYYAIYKAIKGAKLIPLPPFTDNVFNIVYVLACARVKIGDEFSGESLYKAKNNIISDIDSIKEIEYIKQSEDESILKLYTYRKVYNIAVTRDVARILSEIAVIMIRKKQASSNINFMRRVIYRGFLEMGRCSQ